VIQGKLALPKGQSAPMVGYGEQCTWSKLQAGETEKKEQHRSQEGRTNPLLQMFATRYNPLLQLTFDMDNAVVGGSDRGTAERATQHDYGLTSFVTASSSFMPRADCKPEELGRGRRWVTGWITVTTTQ
jgi:hypothetical protein